MHSARKWICLLSGAVMMLLLGLLYAWSIYKEGFQALFPDWTETGLSLTFTISLVFFCLGGFLGGKLTGRVSGRSIALLSALFLFVGLAGVSRLNAQSPQAGLLLLYLFYGVFYGTGVGLGYNSVLSTVIKWFPERSGLVSGLLMLGFGCGGMIFGGLINLVIEHRGLLHAFSRLALFVPLTVALCSRLLYAAKTEARPAARQEAGGREYSAAEMLRTPSFWFFFLYAVVVSTAGLMVINNAAGIAVAFGAPSALGLLVSMSNGGGRLLIGMVFDKRGRRTTMQINALILFLAVLSFLGGMAARWTPLILLGILLTGVGYGGSPSLTSSITFCHFGEKNYPVNFSVANLNLIPAAIAGPMLSSSLLSLSGGSYQGIFLLMAALAVLAFGITLVMGRESARATPLGQVAADK